MHNAMYALRRSLLAVIASREILVGIYAINWADHPTQATADQLARERERLVCDRARLAALDAHDTRSTTEYDSCGAAD